MPTHKQGTVISPAIERAMGSAGANQLASAYGASLIYSGEIDPDTIQAQFQSEVLDAIINDGGHTFGEFDTSYSEAPNVNDVETGGAGLPGSPYVPNVSSPGPGSLNAADQPEPPEGFGETPSDTWGTGVGSQLTPKNSSEKISGQTLGSYIMGRSSE
jgi:hypothetical protein